MDTQLPIALEPIIPPVSPIPQPARTVPVGLIAIFAFILGVASVLIYQKYLPAGLNPVGSTSASPSLNPSPTIQSDIYQGKYFSISKSTKWKFLSDVNQSPATPEVLETVAFENDQARLNIQVGTNTINQMLNAQDGEIIGQVLIDGIMATKKSGYGGIAGSVYSINLVAPYKEKTYLIGFYTQDTQNISVYEKDFNLILSTFKFD